MTAARLIAILEDIPPETPIYIEAYNSGYGGYKYVDSAYVDNDYEEDRHGDGDGATIRVFVLG